MMLWFILFCVVSKIMVVWLVDFGCYTATHFSHFSCIFYGARTHNERNLVANKQITALSL